MKKYCYFSGWLGPETEIIYVVPEYYVEELVNCYGCYTKEQDGEIVQIDSFEDEAYYTREELDEGKIYYDENLTDKAEFDDFNYINYAVIEQGKRRFTEGEWELCNKEFEQKCKNVWKDENEEFYIDISHEMDFYKMLKKESEMTDEDWERPNRFK